MTRHHIAVIALALLLGLTLAAAGPTLAADPVQQDTPGDDLLERGEYLAQISACIECHSPLLDNGLPDPGNLLAGGRPFDLGPLGIVYSQNLTPAGIGGWTDEELEAAIRTGISPDGYQSFPLMPYVWYNAYSDEDMAALIAYLRSIEPIENETAIPREQVLPDDQLPQLPPSTGAAVAPQGPGIERGAYLVRNVMACYECHVPLDPATGNPLVAEAPSGGQPYEGPWGIAYGANITPDEETGIGAWSDTEIVRAIRSGIRPDGRVLVVMPWPEYGVLTDDDARSIAMYLRSLDPVTNEVPAPALEEGFVRYVEVEETEAEPGSDMRIGVVMAVAVIVLMAIGGALAFAMSLAGAQTGSAPSKK